MNTLLFHPDLLAAGFWPTVGSALLYSFGFLLPLTALTMIAYKLLSVPLQRRMRARLFLDLVETAIRDGRSVESTLISASASRDSSPGLAFHLLAAHLETGLVLGPALERVPRLVPPQVRLLLRAGERIGDINKVLPACRRLLQDSISQTRGALNYLLVLVFIITPFAGLAPLMITTFILPKFKQIFVEMLQGAALPHLTQLVFENSRAMALLQITFVGLVWLVMIGYVGGPRLTHWIRQLAPNFPDRFFHALPWRRRRLQRDFSALLSVLLDAGVPEVEAIALAADATDNNVVRNRAAQACDQLKRGVSLPEAIRIMDDTGEFHWRMSNACQRDGTFARALAGWHDALDARAFQLEQTAAQVATTGLVLLNGLIVALVCAGMFVALIHITMEAALW